MQILKIFISPSMLFCNVSDSNFFHLLFKAIRAIKNLPNIQQPHQNYFRVFSKSVYVIYFTNAINGICNLLKIIIIYLILQCFQIQLLSFTLQTHMKANAEFKNCNLPNKRYFEVFSNSTLVVYSTNAIISINR